MHYEQVFELLTKEYSFILATTPQDFSYVKKLREDIISHHYPELKETKEYDKYLFSLNDQQSFIYLLRHNDTGAFVGSVRLFFINDNTPLRQLPMQEDFNIKNIEQLTHNLPIIEVSRGALIHNLPKHEKLSGLKLRTMLTYGLMVATRINFLLYRYATVFSIMEPALHHILKRQKIHFKSIGEPIKHYGVRIPYAISWEQILLDTEISMGKITNYYLKQLCENPEPFWKFIDKNPYLERSDIHLNEICALFDKYGDDADLTQLITGKESQPLFTTV